MRACRIQVSQTLLLQHIGLLDREEDLTVYHAEVNPHTGIVTLYLAGGHPDLPEVREGDVVPLANVKAERIRSTLTFG